MYIDGYVPDYYYTYKATYAPDARAIMLWVEQEEFDPFPDMELPLSTLPALTPLEACLALMPKTGGVSEMHRGVSEVSGGGRRTSNQRIEATKHMGRRAHVGLCAALPCHKSCLSFPLRYKHQDVTV